MTHSAKITRVWDETPWLRGIALEAPGAARAHATPGQYLVVELPEGKKGYFALANPPGSEALELLIKKEGAAAEILCSKKVGDALTISAPAGRGYPVGEHKGKDLLLFAAGSGIAPIRALLRHVLARREDFGRVRLYYSHREPGEFAYRREHQEWARGGVELILSVTGKDPSWKGHRGRVQDLFAGDPPDASRSVVFVCGMKDMIEAVTDVLERHGVPREHVLTNF